MNRKFLTSTLVIIFSLSIAGILSAGKKPEEQSGYEKGKDVGLKAPKGAEVLFDGTMKSVKKNWVMWPKKDMDITWKIMDNPNGDGKTLMTDGGRKWGTHDLVTKKKYSDYEGHVEFIMMGGRGDNKPDGYTIAEFICRTVMKFRLNLLKEKISQILITGRSDHMELPLFAWTEYQTATHGDPMVSGMPFILFLRMQNGTGIKKSPMPGPQFGGMESRYMITPRLRKQMVESR